MIGRRLLPWIGSSSLFVSVATWGATWQVPSQCPTIQSGIDSAAVGDTVLVACGTYHEHDIVMQSGICLRSMTGDADCTVIDAQQLGRVLECTGLDSLTSVEGFTLTGGLTTAGNGGGIACGYSDLTLVDCLVSGNSAANGTGGGIHCTSSAPTIVGCRLSDNIAGYSGGGLYCEDSSPTLVDCTFSGNATDGRGGGLVCSNSYPFIESCTVTGNRAEGDGGAVALLAGSAPDLVSCTISGNFAAEEGGGVWCFESTPTLVNTVLWGNCAVSGDELYCPLPGSSVTFTCCDVDDSGLDGSCSITWQEGNLFEDPLFSGPASCASAPTSDGDYTINHKSPCADAPGCGLIGALGVGSGYLVKPDGTGDFPTIQEAIDAASDGHLIELADGTFTGPGNRDVDFLGKAITVRSESGTPELCIIDCEAAEFDWHRGFIFQSGEDSTSVLADLTITHGFQDSTYWIGGGAILCESSSPTISGCILTDNTAAVGGARGGAITCDGDASPTISGCTFSGNQAAVGAAIACFGPSSPTVVGCLISGNNAHGPVGGIISCENTSSLQLSGTTVSGNMSCGLYCTDSTDVTIDACHITENVANIGSGVSCWGQSVVTIDQSTISNNGDITFPFFGGGVSSGHQSSVVITNTVISGNEAQAGGGLFVGGPGSSCTTIGCTVTDNLAFTGGGIFGDTGATVAVENTILWDSTPDAMYLQGAIVSFTCTNVDSSQVNGPGLVSWLGGNVFTSPFFCDAASSDFHLKSCSPCLDAPGCGRIGALDVGCAGRTWYVATTGSDSTGDGSLGSPYATIQRGIDDASPCDTVLVACGTYSDCTHADGEGELNCVKMVAGITVRSETGQPSCVTVDAGSLGRPVYCNNVDGTASMTGFTLTGGLLGGPGGGAIYCSNSSPSFVNCELSANVAGLGGAVSCSFSSPRLTGCTLVHNECTDQGAGLYLSQSYPVLENTIVAFNIGGAAVACGTAQPQISCSDIYGNGSGDWVDCIADQYGTLGNISGDPLFCEPDSGDYTISEYSPCASAQSACGQIGAHGVACSVPTDAEPVVVVPSALSLGLAVPNPFRSETEIQYGLPSGPSRVTLTVYDAAGRRIVTLVDSERGPGIYKTTWDGRDHRGTLVASGVYFYRLEWNGNRKAERVILLK